MDRRTKDLVSALTISLTWATKEIKVLRGEARYNMEPKPPGFPIPIPNPDGSDDPDYPWKKGVPVT